MPAPSSSRARSDSIVVGGNSGGAGSIEDRIYGYTKIGIEKYHIQHLKELVAPDFPETKLGGYLLNTFVERDPWLSGECIAQIFRAEVLQFLRVRVRVHGR